MQSKCNSNLILLGRQVYFPSLSRRYNFDRLYLCIIYIIYRISLKNLNLLWINRLILISNKWQFSKHTNIWVIIYVNIRLRLHPGDENLFMFFIPDAPARTCTHTYRHSIQHEIFIHAVQRFGLLDKKAARHHKPRYTDKGAVNRKQQRKGWIRDERRLRKTSNTPVKDNNIFRWKALVQREGIWDVRGKMERMMGEQSNRNGNLQAGRYNKRERENERARPF